MRLCLDEHYSPLIAVELRKRGYDVVSVAEEPELAGLSDAELLAAAVAQQRALLTEDVGDFAALLRAMTAAGESHYGVVYSSPQSLPRSRGAIGLFVRALESLLDRNPGEDTLRDGTFWLVP